MSEIELRPIHPGHDGHRDAPVSRQGVRQHVEKLVDAGVVQVRPGRRESGPVQEFLVNHARLFALSEEFRKLGTLRPHAHWAIETLDGVSARAPAPVRGPRLVLVHGVREGTVFHLHGARGKTRWTVGRDAACDVPLDFDPFVSGVNCVVEARKRAFVLRDLPESRNGTRLNWESVPRGSEAPLEAGDVIGVGRSLLVFRA